MIRKAGSVAVIAALVVLSGVAMPGTVGGAPAAPLGVDTPSLAGPAVAPQADDGNATDTSGGTTNDGEANSTGNASLGTQLSSFMAASTAEAETEVESGMFRAEWNRSNASQRERLVRHRTGDIAERIEELRERREELLAAENPTARERAQAAWLATQANGLARSIGQMAEAANRTNVTVDRAAIGELRRNARNLTEGEIADLAPDFVDRGPPEDAGPPDGAGPPGDAGSPDEERERGNGTDAGPPDEPRGEGDGTDDGPPDDPGGGEGSGEPGGSGNDGAPGNDGSGDGDPGGGSGDGGAGSGDGGGSGNGNGSGGSGNPGGGDGGSGSGSGEGKGSGSGSGENPGGGDGGSGSGTGNGNDGGTGSGNGNGSGNDNGN